MINSTTDHTMKAIKPSNLPSSLPVSLTISSGLLMDHMHSPGWAWGIWGTIMAIYWIAIILVIYNTDHVDVLAGKN